MQSSTDIKEAIKNLVTEYYLKVHKKESTYNEGDRIPYAGRQFNEEELHNLVDAALDFWLTSGTYTYTFEKELAGFLDIPYCYTCNSGSSANLLAFMALTSPLLGERQIQRGDEVITVAAGFPTTVAPIIQYGAIPVFVDITVPEYNIDCTQLEAARTKRTKAVVLAHTLGNPFDLEQVMAFCKKYNLWLIEDNCDALGSKYFYEGKWQYTGTIGDIGTSSFYPPHHMTMGEGGAVYTRNPKLAKIILSLRDWGRDCCCPPGIDNFCKMRFSHQYEALPFGYDHKYVYSHLGYNLKITDLQAAIGCAQLKKLPSFIKARKDNWKYLRLELESMKEKFILPEPNPKSDVSWFGFMIGIPKNSSYTRNEVVKYLESRGVQTRMLFAGNIIKHPCFDQLRKAQVGYRQIGALEYTDFVMNQVFWIGVYPGMTKEMLDYMIKTLKEAVGGSEVLKGE